MSEVKERYFGDADPFDLPDAPQIMETPQQAAIRQARQITKAPPKTTMMERLLEERTKEALEESRKQVRQIAEAAERKMKDLQEKLQLYEDVLQKVSDGKMSKFEVMEFIAFRKRND